MQLDEPNFITFPCYNTALETLRRFYDNSGIYNTSCRVRLCELLWPDFIESFTVPWTVAVSLCPFPSSTSNGQFGGYSSMNRCVSLHMWLVAPEFIIQRPVERRFLLADKTWLTTSSLSSTRCCVSVLCFLMCFSLALLCWDSSCFLQLCAQVLLKWHLSPFLKLCLALKAPPLAGLLELLPQLGAFFQSLCNNLHIRYCFVCFECSYQHVVSFRKTREKIHNAIAISNCVSHNCKLSVISFMWDCIDTLSFSLRECSFLLKHRWLVQVFFCNWSARVFQTLLGSVGFPSRYRSISSMDSTIIANACLNLPKVKLRSSVCSAGCRWRFHSIDYLPYAVSH